MRSTLARDLPPVKRVLMVAYHFPPMRGSSGIQRTLRFARFLPAFGWDPIVLTVQIRAYDAVADDQLADIPQHVHVCRAFALDTSRHLALAGRYPGFLARPDRWKSWWLGGVPAGLALVRRLRPQAIWSTYPVATAHAIAGTLQRLTRLPWIADFRDPMAQQGYPADPRTWRSFRRIEDIVAQRASRLVFTTPSALATYRERFPVLAPDHLVLIENGFDEEVFAPLEGIECTPLNAGCVTLLHSGIVYPDERDPTALIEALRRLREHDPELAGRLRVRFRAPVHDDLLHGLAAHAGVGPMIEVMPPLAYRSALEEMLRADALLILQAANCNAQIPAKVYEYFRARRPILALTDRAGDTAATLAANGVSAIAPLDDAAAIATLIGDFVRDPARYGASAVDHDRIQRNSRRERTRQLASLLDEVAVGADAIRR